MGDALRSRFTHLQAEVDVNDWLAYAEQSEFHPAVQAFVRFRPELLHKYFKGAARSFPCPRTWEFVSKILDGGKLSSDVELGLINGTIGEEAGVEFVAFLRLYRDLPDIEVILSKPHRAEIPTAPATLYAVSSALARRATRANIERVMTYLNRFPARDYVVMAVKEMLRLTPALETSASVTAWKIANQDIIL